ncbi:DUF3306 domain-containing protein [Roseibaca sp. Y0-43]|uniref:DUF3306 domain-containing protein n=1 Tax=Roseibaca sp. Y0-43 TaxID=2816854 RepID=UPI001D0BF5B0|nr:DUF3306 domain-containing protein [Roseibaca sp. Y0-43]MCC1481660.1 DUF3306 domain-containing protein [Roseibaca sp. Y0-43]
MPRGPDDREGGFFNRWSQRKQQALREDTPALDAGAPEDAETPDTAPETPSEPQLTEEELAALPKIEELTADSDIRMFMRAGVPKSLRNAALRKMWLLTPAIRNHVDPAVDYAWDWNTPGGVPGDGIAPSPEKAAQMLRDLFKPRQKAAAEAADTAESAEIATDDAGTAEDTAQAAASDGAQDAPVADPAPPPPDPVRRSGQGRQPVANKEENQPDRVAQLQPAPRRHGGALPQ